MFLAHRRSRRSRPRRSVAAHRHRLRQRDPRPRHPRRRRRRPGAARPARRPAAVPRPSSTSGYYRNPEATKRCSTASGSTPATAPTSRKAMLFITGREKDIIIRGGRNISPYELEQAVGDLAGVRRGCVAVFGATTRRAAPSGSWCSPRCARRTLAPRRAVKRMINELAVEPDRRAGGRYRARAAAHRAEDVQRQDPPRRGARVLRARAFSVRPQAVWLQFVRLAAAGVAPQLRRALTRCRGAVFALRGCLVFAALSRRVRSRRAVARSGLLAAGSAMSRGFLRLSGHSGGRARPREPSRRGPRRARGEPYELSRRGRAALAVGLARATRSSPSASFSATP